MISSSLVRRSRFFLNKQITRNTWVLRRVFTPESTPEGRIQRNPNDFQDFQKYEVVEFETNKKATPLRLILLEDVESVGHQFDIVEVERGLARRDLLLPKKAVYASPFDLEYFSNMKEKMAKELASRIRIPYELKIVGRDLQKMVIPIKVNLENSWVINKKLVKASLRQMGVFVNEDTIFLSSKEISGPNFDIEAKIFRFYIVVERQYIIPMLGRISHISVDETKQIISSKLTTPRDEELAKYSVRKEFPLYSKTQDFGPEFDVFGFMEKHAPLKPQ